jgi:hypothetical protein
VVAATWPAEELPVSVPVAVRHGGGDGFRADDQPVAELEGRLLQYICGSTYPTPLLSDKRLGIDHWLFEQVVFGANG